MEYIPPEVIIRDLQRRLRAVEAERDQWRQKAGEYLGKWIAAQDVASWRNVLLCAATVPQALPAAPKIE